MTVIVRSRLSQRLLSLTLRKKVNKDCCVHLAEEKQTMKPHVIHV